MKDRNSQKKGQTPNENPSESSMEKRDLDSTLHRLLVIGLVISVILILTGLTLTLIRHQELPSSVLPFGLIFSNMIALEASGFFSMGLLVLIATPIFRVISSFIAFIIERDWKFAGITLVVLITVIVSILLGKY